MWYAGNNARGWLMVTKTLADELAQSKYLSYAQAKQILLASGHWRQRPRQLWPQSFQLPLPEETLLLRWRQNSVRSAKAVTLQTNLLQQAFDVLLVHCFLFLTLESEIVRIELFNKFFKMIKLCLFLSSWFVVNPKMRGDCGGVKLKFMYYSLETNLNIPLQFYLFKWLSKEIMKRASTCKLGAIVPDATKDHSEAVLGKRIIKQGKKWRHETKMKSRMYSAQWRGAVSYQPA